MTTEQIERTKKTRFKKGNIPHNTKSDYEISYRGQKNDYGYFHIRISLGKWVLFHRWLWEQLYGEIPEGHNIQFKDGDSTNCDPGNLYMIDKNRQSILNRNGGKKIPFHLKETILLINELKFSINEKQNHRLK